MIEVPSNLHQTTDFLIYISKTKIVLQLVPALIIIPYVIYRIYMLITKLHDGAPSKKKYFLKKEFWFSLIYCFFLFALIMVYSRHLSLLFQKSPELTINNSGIKFNSVGFLPWSEVDYLAKGRRGWRGRQENFFTVNLKSDSTWQPQASSFLGASTFSDKKITVEDVLDVNLNVLRDKLSQIKPSITIYE